MIWADAYNGGSSSGVSMGIPHSDFIVSLGRWNGDRGGTDREKIGTFAHELGHNLGRMHGGSEHVNFKANHISIMNYFYQTRGIRRGDRRIFDYQRFSLPSLFEDDLRESFGLGLSASLEDYYTIFYSSGGAAIEVPAWEPIDWDNDGTIDASSVMADLNDDTLLDELLATPNEWDQVIYNGGSIGSVDTLDRALESAEEQSRSLPFVELNEEMIAESSSIEAALQSVEADADAALRALSAAVKETKRAKAAAATGQVRQLQQALDAAAQLADVATRAVADVRAGWRFDVHDWFASGQYTKELLAAAAEADVRAVESDERILSYPAVVEISPADATVVVDKRKERGIRPSAVVRHLADLQQRPPKFKAEAFIASLAAAYDLVVGTKALRRGAAVKVVDVHRVLTLLPGAARDYTRQEFARDLYLLDQSGVVDTKGRRMSLPASAMTRSAGVLTTVTRGGQTKIYAGISFVEQTA